MDNLFGLHASDNVPSPTLIREAADYIESTPDSDHENQRSRPRYEMDLTQSIRDLRNSSASTAFDAYFSRWISIFDAPVFTIVDRGSNLANEHMADNLRMMDSQLCPVPTEAPWSIGRNERSHRFLHKAIEKLLTSSNFNIGPDLFRLLRLLGEVEIAWNCTQHTNRVLPHLHRLFGVMPRALGELDNSPTTQERIALMQLLRTETEKIRTKGVIKSAMQSSRRHVTSLCHFSVCQKVWFYRRNFGWRTGCISHIDRPTICVSLDKKLFPTHENRIRPFSGELSLPLEILANDNDEQAVIESPHDAPLCTQPATTYTRAPISDLLNPVFCVRNLETVDCPLLSTPKLEDHFGLIDADTSRRHKTTFAFSDIPGTFIVSQQHIKGVNRLPPDQQDAFRQVQEEETKFLLSDAVMPIPSREMESHCELQPLKWILTIKRSTNADTPTRFRARLVSASHLSPLLHALNGNAPTISSSTIRALLLLAPTWDQELRTKGDRLMILVRDVTKAYIQSKPTERLVYYQPPKEFFEIHPDKSGYIRRANIQLYGDVEAGKYWHKTFVPWSCENFLDYQQEMYDPSLLFSPSTSAATALCTDDAMTFIPRSKRNEEAKMATRFKCRIAQEPPTEFKGLDLIQEGSNVRISQAAYSSQLKVDSTLQNLSKPELNRVMTDK